MQFASARFAVFFLVVATVAWTVPERLRKPWLVLASLVFYAAADPRWLAVLGAVAGIGWAAGAWIDRAASRRTVAAVAIGSCLAILALFKYWEFGRANLDAAIAILRPHRARLQGAALAVDAPRAPAVEDELAALGLSYVCPPGRLQSPGASWLNGGIDLVRELASDGLA